MLLLHRQLLSYRINSSPLVRIGVVVYFCLCDQSQRSIDDFAVEFANVAGRRLESVDVFLCTIAFLCLMVVNGLCQGGIFPSIARLVLLWYPDSLRGSYWSIVSMASNVGYGAKKRLFGAIIWRHDHLPRQARDKC